MRRNPLTNAKLIQKELEKYVKNQTLGIKSVATAVSQHILRYDMRFIESFSTVVPKQNLLIVGESGCGKTLTFSKIEELLKHNNIEIPIAKINSLSYAPTDSWAGTTFTFVFDMLVDAAAEIYFKNYGYDDPHDIQESIIIDIVEHGIILIDEFDKLNLNSNEHKKFCYDYQSNLLKAIEGNEYYIDYTYENTVPVADPDDGHIEYRDIKINFNNIRINSENIMFVFLGAFTGIDRIVKHRLMNNWQKTHKPAPVINDKHWEYQQNHIGFLATPHSNATDTKNKKSETDEPHFSDEQLIPTSDDIIQYGIMKELVGRIPVITMYKRLSTKGLMHILTDCEASPLNEFKMRFSAMGHQLEWDTSAVRWFAERSIALGLGARGLRRILSETLTESLYELSAETEPHICRITGKLLKSGKPPIIEKRSQKRQQNKQNTQSDAEIMEIINNSTIRKAETA